MATTITTNSPKLTANIADHADVYGGRALVFDGVSDYLDCGDLTFLNSTSAFSISVWIKSDSTNSLDYICSKNFGNNRIHIAISYNIMYFNVSNGTNTYGTVPFTSTDWNHISLVFNGSGTGNSNKLKAYINGEEQSLTFTGTTPSTTANLSGIAFQIGRRDNDYFSGKMCDFKIFNTALTEAQVQELYKKPENTPSAVQDNLVAWYPMIEGNPESPQSIVYDHSEKKLGASEITSASNTTFSGVSSNDWTSSGATKSFSNDQMVFTMDGDSPAVVAQLSSGNFVGGSGIPLKFLKVTLDVDSTTTGSYRINNAGGSCSANVFEKNPLTTGINTVYGLCDGANSYFRILEADVSTGDKLVLNSFDVKEVFMGNHATTNFFGDELVTNGDFELDSNWADKNTPTVNERSTEQANGGTYSRKFTADAISDGIQSDTFSVTAGITYKVSVDVYPDDNTQIRVVLRKGDGSHADADNSYTSLTQDAWNTLEFTYVAELTGSGTYIIILSKLTSGTYYIDNVTVKEVGVSSSGFETAVNEPVVPQVPLMRYNQKMYFDGVDDYVSLDGDVSLANDFTIEIWASTLKSGSNDFLGHASDNTFIRTDTNNNRLRIRNTSGSIANLTSFTIPTDGSVFHLVLSRNSGSITAYLNGVKTGNTPTLYGALNINEIGNVSGNTEYDGLIFSVSIFNSAFTETEAQELFNDGVALDATTHSKANDYLLGYWRNDGVTTWTDRSDIQAIGFDGSDDNIDFGNDSSLQPASELTVSAWAYMNNWSSASQSRIISNTQSGGYAIALDEVNDNNISFFVNNGAYLNPNYALSNLSSGWHHVCATYKNKTAKLYIDGSLVDTDTNTNNTNITYNSNVKLFAGAEPDASNNTSIFFNGLLGQIAVFNRELISSEISAIYALGRRTDLTTSYSTNLQGYWFLNPTHSNPDLTGADKILDRSGNGNHGTQSGGVNFLGANDGDVQGTPDSITIREGLNSNRDGLGFYFKNADSNTLRLNRKLEHLVIPYTKSLSATSMSDAITVECWVKFHNHPTGYNVIAGNASGGSWSNGWALAMVDNGLRFTINNYNSPKATFQITDFTKWYHIVGIYDRSLSSNNVALYVDLVRGTSAHYTTPIGESNQGIHIGYLHGEGAGVKASTCLIDELRIYNRVLTAFEADGSTPEDGETAISGEIVKNYKHGKGKHKND